MYCGMSSTAYNIEIKQTIFFLIFSFIFFLNDNYIRIKQIHVIHI